MVGAVVLALAVLTRLGPQWWFLEDLELRSGESELLREESPSVGYIQHGAPQAAFGSKLTRSWPKCQVLLTNQRLVVAQKGLGSAKYIIRVIFELDGDRATDEPKPTGGFLFHISRDKLRADGDLLRVSTPGFDWEIQTANAARYADLGTSA